MRSRTLASALALLAAGALLAPVAAHAQGARDGGADIPRMPDGRPDLSGTYDLATLTPFTRPAEYGDRLTLSDEEAGSIAEARAREVAAGARESDPNRDAPPEGGDGSVGAAGNVGGYNDFWIARGEGAFQLDGKWRTSILVDPPNGQLPPLTEEARARQAERGRSFRRQNDGEAWWIDEESGPYDDPEIRGLAERCLLGFGSTAGPPMLPNYFYNNLKRIVQTEHHVMILAEMIHDARIIRIADEHDPPELRKWVGDSVGRWEGDTLVVETVHFGDTPSFSRGSASMRVVERFSRIDDETIRYHFTVEDPTVWTAPFSGEMPWPATEDRVYEYACHEGNYALGNILRGARLLEAEALARRPAGEPTRP
ncbi:MAG TPA: hypothetical protein VMV46_15750 [Thermoanaerobaculia bacterium]|nr:hypothetical protein [Thermoanaerobaculia bacterium]